MVGNNRDGEERVSAIPKEPGGPLVGECDEFAPTDNLQLRALVDWLSHLRG